MLVSCTVDSDTDQLLPDARSRPKIMVIMGANKRRGVSPSVASISMDDVRNIGCPQLLHYPHQSQPQSRHHQQQQTRRMLPTIDRENHQHQHSVFTVCPVDQRLWELCPCRIKMRARIEKIGHESAEDLYPIFIPEFMGPGGRDDGPTRRGETDDLSQSDDADSVDAQMRDRSMSLPKRVLELHPLHMHVRRKSSVSSTSSSDGGSNDNQHQNNHHHHHHHHHQGPLSKALAAIDTNLRRLSLHSLEHWRQRNRSGSTQSAEYPAGSYAQIKHVDFDLMPHATLRVKNGGSQKFLNGSIDSLNSNMEDSHFLGVKSHHNPVSKLHSTPDKYRITRRPPVVSHQRRFRPRSQSVSSVRT